MLDSKHRQRPIISDCVGYDMLMAYILPQCWMYCYPFLICMHSRQKKKQENPAVLHIKVDNKEIRKILFPDKQP